MSICKRLYSFLFLIFLNNLITLIVFFDSLSLNSLTNSAFNWSKICLLILLVSFLDGLMGLVVGWLIKFSLCFFKVTQELNVPFLSILSYISACFCKLDTFSVDFCFKVFICRFHLLFYRWLQWHYSKGFYCRSCSICPYWMSCLQEFVSFLMPALFYIFT